QFLYYLLSSDSFFAYNTRHARGGKMPRGSKQAILSYRIPLPPLAAQMEIAATLGKMEQLDAELDAELSARRYQYSHYRDKLLTFEQDQVRWGRLGDLGTLFRGKRFTKRDMVPLGEGVACIHYGEIYTHFGTAAHSVISNVRTD